MLDFRDPARVHLRVSDDGTDSPREPRTGFGLRGLRERLSTAGGTLTAGKRASGGFELHAEVPG